MGVNAALTYPNSVREKQHVNIRAIPKNIHPPLRSGTAGTAAAASASASSA
jgi:hypothetical protein